MGDMMESGQIEVLARGVCVMDDRLLVCRTKGEANTYLPGGHVEFREEAAAGLRRELQEELGISCVVESFLGVVEHAFIQKGEQHCEVNLVFAINAPGLSSESAPASKEDHIEFAWLSVPGIAESDLEPKPLRDLIPQWLADPADVPRLGSSVVG